MRDQTLDITKGIGILLVVVGHIYTYNQLIYLFICLFSLSYRGRAFPIPDIHFPSERNGKH